MQEPLGGAGPDGRRERREAEESIKLLHRKAAALAWYRHGRRGSSAAAGRSASRMQLHSLSHVPGKHSIQQPQDPDPFKVSGLHIPAAVGPDCGSALPSLPPVHQPSRFKAEALSRAAALQPSLSVIDATSAASNKQIMSAGQSLALLSLLPQHQSQKCFQSKKDGSSSGTPWDCGSSLYDSFELLCLSNQLGRCLTTVHAAAAAATSPSSSTHYKLLKNAPPPPPPLPPPPRTPFHVPPAYIPRSLYALPQFILPNYLATKSSRKRSPLIHPLFSTPNNAPSAPTASLPPPPPNHHPPDKASKHKASGGGGGFRRVFNSLLKTLHIKDSPEPPRRSNLSDELKKLPGRPRAPCPKDSPPLNERPRAEAPPKMKDSHAHHHVHHHHHHHHHFRNEGFRTTTKAPKSVKWAQPGAF